MVDREWTDVTADDDAELERIQSQDSWDVWHLDTFLGKVSWTGNDIFISGPHADRIKDIVESMGRGMDREELFRSLPFRLTGYISLAYPVPLGGQA